jgi:acyl-CoA thioester hydrolase
MDGIMIEKDLLMHVFYEDTDFTGYVFHANFLRYFSRAREEFLGLKNLKNLYNLGKHFVVRSCQMTFHKPVSHGDLLLIRSRATESQGAVIMFEQLLYLKNEEGQLTLAVSAIIELVTVGRTGAPIRVPQDIKDLCFRSLQHDPVLVNEKRT